MEEIFRFLIDLKSNNHREWFNEHKEQYNLARKNFETICSSLILRMGEFDKDMLKVTPQECMFRIYRDIRFSPDKTPYKTHFGTYMAFPGGRKSPRAGYYLHIDPAEGCFFSAGIWSPEPPVLKALRQSVYDNYEEFNEIRRDPEFHEVFGDSFMEEEMLKKIPAGFPKDFPEPNLLKLKHYLVSHNLSDDELFSNDFTDRLAHFAKVAFPFNRFLNYAVDELQ